MPVKRFVACLSLAALPLAAQTPPKPVLMIGGEDARGTELGVVRSVAVLPSLLVVIEGAAPFVKVFDHHGKLMQSFGQVGAGPGEFRAPGEIAFDSVNRMLWIADARLGRVTQFAVGDTLRWASEHLSAVNIRNLCAMNGAVFAVSPLDGHLVHELGLVAERYAARRSFGTLESRHPQAATAMVRSLITAGPMYCDAARQVVYTASRDLGEVHRVDLRTGVQTTTPVRSFLGLDIVPTGENSVQFSGPARGWADQIADLQPAADGVSLVLVANGTAPNRPPFEVITMSATGVQSARVPYMWRPLGRVGALVVCSTNDPVPAIAYFALPRCP
jgi:hypothetical protein